MAKQSALQKALSSLRDLQERVKKTPFGRVATASQKAIQLQPFRTTQSQRAVAVGRGLQKASARIPQVTPQSTFLRLQPQFGGAVQLAKTELGEKGRTIERFATPKGRREVGQSFKKLFTERPTFDTLSSPAAETVFTAADFLPGAKQLATVGTAGFLIRRRGIKDILKKSDLKVLDTFIDSVKGGGGRKALGQTAKDVQNIIEQPQVRRTLAKIMGRDPLTVTNKTLAKGLDRFVEATEASIGFQAKAIGDVAEAQKLKVKPLKPTKGLKAKKLVDNVALELEQGRSIPQATRTLAEESDTVVKAVGKNPSSNIIADLGKQADEVTNSLKDIPPVQKVNAIDYMRTPHKVLRKIGLTKEANLLKTKYRNYLRDIPKEIDKITEWSKRAPDSPKVFKALDGQKVDLLPQEKQVVNEIQTYLSNWADKLNLPKDRRIASYITHIFENDFIQKDFDPELAKIIADKVPGSVYDPFLEKRLGKTGYIEDAYRSLDAYVKRATRKFHMDQALGPLKKATKKLDLESERFVKRLADRINLRPTEVDSLIDNAIKGTPVGFKFGARPLSAISRKIRQQTYRGTLGLNFGSAMRNLTQGSNTYAKLGNKYTVKGYGKVLKEIANPTGELKAVGVLADNIIQDRALSSQKKLWQTIDEKMWTFFDFAEKINRGSAYFGQKAKSLDLGKTEAQAVKDAVDLVEDTQFVFGPLDTPLALQSDISKTISQFQSFNIKQAEFLADMVKNKEASGFIRYIGSSLVMMASVGKLFGMELKDIVPFSDIISGESKFGQTPAIQGVKAGFQTAFGGEEGREKGLATLKKLAPAFIPGGIQAKKTIQGAEFIKKGRSETPGGRVRFKAPETTGGKAQALVFGQFATPEAKGFFKRGEGAASLKTVNAREAVRNINKAKTREEQIQIFRGLSKDEQKKAKDILKEERLGLTKKEKTLKNSTVLKRAETVNAMLKKAKTREEQIEIVRDLQAKGIMTKSVQKQLVELNK